MGRWTWNPQLQSEMNHSQLNHCINTDAVLPGMQQTFCPGGRGGLSAWCYWCSYCFAGQLACLRETVEERSALGVLTPYQTPRGGGFVYRGRIPSTNPGRPLGIVLSFQPMVLCSLLQGILGLTTLSTSKPPKSHLSITDCCEPARKSRELRIGCRPPSLLYPVLNFWAVYLQKAMRTCGPLRLWKAVVEVTWPPPATRGDCSDGGNQPEGDEYDTLKLFSKATIIRHWHPVEF